MTRSRLVDAATGWWPGARRRLPPSGLRLPARITGAEACPDSATLQHQWCSSAWHRQRTAPIARAACSPATARETSCTRHSIDAVSPTSPSRSGVAMGWCCTMRTSPRPCAARRRPTSPHPWNEMPADRSLYANWRCWPMPALRSPWARSPTTCCVPSGAYGLRPRFGHGAIVEVPAVSDPVEPRPLGGISRILCSFHPSQQNTFTGRLTADMADTVLRDARRLANLSPV